MTCGWTAFTSNQGKMLDWCLAIILAMVCFFDAPRAEPRNQRMDREIHHHGGCECIHRDRRLGVTVMGIHDASALGLEAMPGPGAVAAGHGAGIPLDFLGCLIVSMSWYGPALLPSGKTARSRQGKHFESRCAGEGSGSRVFPLRILNSPRRSIHLSCD